MSLNVLTTQKPKKIATARPRKEVINVHKSQFEFWRLWYPTLAATLVAIFINSATSADFLKQIKVTMLKQAMFRSYLENKNKEGDMGLFFKFHIETEPGQGLADPNYEIIEMDDLAMFNELNVYGAMMPLPTYKMVKKLKNFPV